MSDVQARIYDRKTMARRFDIRGIFATYSRDSTISQSREISSEGRNAPIWQRREPPHMRLSGTDRLNNT